ncbi:uncharacterized protein J4E92_007247 [Alternaria infectoria]|uniref:uncharacterized protein n=1 Tax=Alternaria infectoria TaxID=45303 RepID=UPI00221FCF50|nr:uncharacterized protein J4E92_007247 [Alternaria infectoria]KAI4924166.1 hypothetical protein J4E92_007247 [Alternaria infectoria]
MGLPLGLPDDDIDVCFPLAEHHLQTRVEPRRELHLLHLVAQQARLRGEIIELRNKSLHYVQHDPDRATSIIAKLGQWWNDVEDYIDPDSRSFDSNATSNMNHTATFLEHNSYWNIFVGTEGANASSTEYSNGLDPFSGFDIPFWFDQEQHWDFT